VSSLPTITTSLSHNADGSIAGIYNAAYDVWFSVNSNGDPNNPTGAYLMVWLYTPVSRQPNGGMVASGQTIPSVDGTWNVYSGTSNGRPCISYVRTPNTTSLTFDLHAFISDAVNKYPGTVLNSYYLTNVFGGFEIWSGGTGLQVTCYYVNMG
jgi:cellulose 1,4-beta-cellobiosidase